MTQSAKRKRGDEAIRSNYAPACSSAVIHPHCDIKTRDIKGQPSNELPHHISLSMFRCSCKTGMVVVLR